MARSPGKLAPGGMRKPAREAQPYQGETGDEKINRCVGMLGTRRVLRMQSKQECTGRPWCSWLYKQNCGKSRHLHGKPTIRHYRYQRGPVQGNYHQREPGKGLQTEREADC